ncbi:hypothetical protein D1AOALGA4SA_4518 [Olavius algarvensis Delta 1 endosymbiont]|nr:hypothetical protein D1AOALGA4SA_4518 [Olavius algarvensis Delta 1 endosymbiont]
MLLFFIKKLLNRCFPCILDDQSPVKWSVASNRAKPADPK